MKKTTAIHIGITPEGSAQWFAENFVDIVRGEMTSYRAPEATTHGTITVDAVLLQSWYQSVRIGAHGHLLR